MTKGKNKKAKALPKCKYCDRPIRFIKRSDGQAIAIEPRVIQYIPRRDSDITVLNLKGSPVSADIVSDGRTGYLEHYCRGSK